MTNGTLIVIDGGDGAGKATQTQMLVRRLIQEEHQVGTIDFPYYQKNTFATLIRECLDGERGDFLHLDPYIASTLFAADRFESKAIINEWLEEGRTVIVDRYVSSNMLHQGSKIQDEAELEKFLKWLDHVEHDIFGMPRPDLHVYLKVDADVRVRLLQHAHDKRENVLDLAETNPQHQKETDEAARRIIARMQNWQTIDCMAGDEVRPREDIHQDLYALVTKYM